MRANPLSPLTDALSSELTLAPSLIADAPSAAASPSGDALSDAQYDDLVAFHGIERERLVLIHPGSHKASPAWPAERYADVADQLAADGWQIAIIGDAPDPERTAGVLGTMQTAALFLVGAVAPRTLPRLIADAQLLLSDDAAAPSPVAFARALGTPHVVLSEHPRDTSSATIARRARAELSDVENAHPGRPFTLHMPAVHDAL
ncbi:glycosyltransferase family 9 protein [Caballeronia sp. Lep1P3]|uniref:glycosyltransferase family 9 protein n=1 Tax=Caballeronia sp. Lep1P3 TaxID=2878150 RepID=UPI001FD0A037|nr:glycosyltransferase family 9 protein [Caballeronia sp. Lep1P3]